MEAPHQITCLAADNCILRHQGGLPDRKASPHGESEAGQALSHAGHSLSGICVIPVEGLQRDVGARDGNAEVLGVHDHKVTEELLHLQWVATNGVTAVA